jgi:hypothetical protein
MPNVSPRLRVLGALGAAGVTAGQVTYHSAIENPLGFNRLMWGYSEFRRTGSWPSLDQLNNVSEGQLENFKEEAIKHANADTVNQIVQEVSTKTKSNGFSPFSDFNFSEFINNLIDSIFKNTIQLLDPVYVQGFFDDLIGQRMFIEIILLILCLSIILLFIVFILNIIFLLNKDKIIKKFNNKFITFYINYQAFFSRLTLFYVPILIFIGLFTLCHGLYWLVTHQIPYESLNIDLHQFITGKTTPNQNVSFLGLILSYKNIKTYKKNNFTITLLKKKNK